MVFEAAFRRVTYLRRDCYVTNARWNPVSVINQCSSQQILFMAISYKRESLRDIAWSGLGF
jgi:hypothetical protein